MSLVKTSKDSLINLIGSLEGLDIAFPPTNADGTPNTAAQDTAVNAIVDALIAQQLLAFSIPTTNVQIKAIANSLMAVVRNYKSSTKKTELL